MRPKIILLLALIVSTLFLNWKSAARQPAVEPEMGLNIKNYPAVAPEQDVGYDFTAGRPMKLTGVGVNFPQAQMRLILQRQWAIWGTGIFSLFFLILVSWRWKMRRHLALMEEQSPEHSSTMIELPSPPSQHSKAS